MDALGAGDSRRRSPGARGARAAARAVAAGARARARVSPPPRTSGPAAACRAHRAARSRAPRVSPTRRCNIRLGIISIERLVTLGDSAPPSTSFEHMAPTVAGDDDAAGGRRPRAGRGGLQECRRAFCHDGPRRALAQIVVYAIRHLSPGRSNSFDNECVSVTSVLNPLTAALHFSTLRSTTTRCPNPIDSIISSSDKTSLRLLRSETTEDSVTGCDGDSTLYGGGVSGEQWIGHITLSNGGAANECCVEVVATSAE